MSKAKAEDKAQTFDFDRDRYPKIDRVFARVLQADELPSGDIERIEVTALANGDATWRVWPARAIEPEGGYLPAE